MAHGLEEFGNVWQRWAELCTACCMDAGQGVGVVQFILILHTRAPWVCKIITTHTSLPFSVIMGVDYNAA